MSRMLAVLIAISIAGCLTPDAPEDDTNATSPTPPTMADLPAPIEETATVSGGADPGSAAGQPPCTAPTAACERYPFTLNTTAKIVAGLSWGVPANDFDLYLFKDDEVAFSSQGGAPGNTEAIEEDLEAGSYEVVVVPWSVAQDTFTLTVTFEPASAEEEDDANESASTF